MKKQLFSILLICVLSLGLCVYGADETVIYEQTFEKYTGGRFETLNETAGKGSWTLLPANPYLAKGEENGNKYMYFVNEKDDVRLPMTYKFNETIDSGTVVFSYDIAHSGTYSPGNPPAFARNTVFFRLFDGNSTERLILFMNACPDFQKLSGAKPDFKSNDGLTDTKVKYADIVPGKPVSVMQVLNLDEDYFETYVDGVFLDRIDGLPFDSVSAWGMFGYNAVNYFDNLSIKTLGELDYSVNVTGENGGNGLEITFTESVSNDALSALDSESIVVTDRQGKKVSVKEVSSSGKKVTVLFDNELEYDEKFAIKLDGLKDKYGRVFDEKTFMSNSEVDENGNTVLRVKNITAYTFDGEEVELKDGITPEVTLIKIEFNTFISEFENGIKLNGEFLAGSVSDKTVTVDIDDVLVGNTNYNLTVDGTVKSLDGTSARDYNIGFKTKEGGFEIKEFSWINESGSKAEISDVIQGAKLKLLLKTVNTSRKNENLYITYSSFMGNIQKKVMLKPVLSKSGKCDEFTLEYTVVENGEDIRGIILDDFTSLVPLADFATVN